jgi:ABC-type Fe3+/spermidine/putrescine transport system ATPase subunit
MFEVRGLAVRAGDFRVEGIDLRMGADGCHVLLGPSGHGKTLLLETLAGLRPPAAGTLVLDGRDITADPPDVRGLGENVRYSHRWRTPDEARARDLEDRLGIARLRERRTRDLSGGERQRVALARALATGSRHLLLDEPFSALHEALRWELRRLVLELQRELGLTILLVTHDLEEAFSMGHWISVMMDGRLVQSAPRSEVYQRPADARVARFLGVNNLFPGTLAEEAGGRVRITCEGLGRDLWVNRDRVAADAGRDVVVGIRPEEVRLVRQGVDRPDPLNHFKGRIAFRHDRAALQTLVFQPDPRVRQSIEIDIATRTWRRMEALPEDQLSASLNPEHLFVMSGTAGCIGRFR